MATKRYKEGELGPGGFPVGAFANLTPTPTPTPNTPTPNKKTTPHISKPSTRLSNTQIQELDLLGQKENLTFADKKNLSFANTQYGYESPTSTFSNLGNIGKALPNEVANSQYIDALYQEKYGRIATENEHTKFDGRTVKDSANLILGQNMSPFSDAPVLEGKPSETDPTIGEEDVTGDLTTDIIEIDDEKKQFGYQEELNKLQAENDKLMAERDKIREEQKVIAEAEKEKAKTDIENGITERDKTQEEIEADQKLIKADQELERLGKINDELSSINESRAAFEAKMLAERGEGWRLKPSVINALNKFDKQTAAAESRKALLNNNLNNASIVIGNLYQSKLDILNDNESSYTKLYNMANNNLITLSKEEEKDMDSKIANIADEKKKIQDKQDTIDSLLEDGNVYDRAIKEYGLDFDDEPEEMMRKANKAAQDQIAINSFMAKYPSAGITANTSVKDAYKQISATTGQDIEIVKQGDNIYSFNKTTGVLTLLEGEGSEPAFETKVDENGNLVKSYKKDAEFIQIINMLDEALTNTLGIKKATGLYGPGRWALFPEARGEKQDFIAAANFIASNLKLTALIESKSKGATFGALSEGEMAILGASATKLGTWEIKDKNGNVIGYDASEESVMTELQRIKDFISKKFPEDEIITKSNEQKVNDFMMANTENRNIIEGMFNDGITNYDDISAALGFNQVGSDTDSASEVDKISQAIGEWESGGNYQAKGPTVTSGMYKGDNALGKYQIMGKNIPSWSKEALGYEVSKTAFLNSPELQNKIAQYKMAIYYNKYGTKEDVMSMWFTGKPYAKTSGESDVTGTSVGGYVEGISSIYNRLT